MSSLLDSIRQKIGKLAPTEPPTPKSNFSVMFMCNSCSYSFKHNEERYVCTECSSLDLCKKCYKRDIKYFKQHKDITAIDDVKVTKDVTDSDGHLLPPLLHTDSAPLPHSFTLERKAQREMAVDNVGKNTYESMRNSFRDNKKRQCIGVRERVPISDKYPNGLGEYKYNTFEEFEELTEYFGQALCHFTPSRSFVTICANNRLEWYVADIACLWYGMPVVPMHHQVNSDAMEEILSNSETKVIITSIDITGKVIDIIEGGKYTGLKLIVVLDDGNDNNNNTSNNNNNNNTTKQRTLELEKRLKEKTDIQVKTYQEMLDMGKKLFNSSKQFKHNPIESDEILSLVYTSGSTGVPKGVITLDKEWNSQISESYMNYPSSSLSYLTLSHSQRRFDHKRLYLGTRIGIFSGSMELLFDDIQKVRPTLFWGVPRIWNLIYSLYQNELDEFIKNNPTSSQEYCIEKCLKKIRNVLGNRLEGIVTGGAPTSEDVLRFMKQCWNGIAISNSYGLSEVIGIFVDGFIQDDIQYRIDPVPEFGYSPTDLPNPRGELVVKSKTMTTGYYNNPKLTSESFQDGWFKTGDIVEQIGYRRVKIIDRKKHAFKLSNGEFVAPELIENTFMGSHLLEQILIYGDAMKTFLVAVIVPRKNLLEECGVLKQLQELESKQSGDKDSETNREERSKLLNQNVSLVQKIYTDLFSIALKKKMANYEIPKLITLDTTKWTTDNELITGSGKICRGKLYKYYKSDIDRMYLEMDQQLQQSNGQNNTMSTIVQAQSISSSDNNQLNQTLIDYLKTTLQVDTSKMDVLNTFSFTQLGGDSLSAIRLSNLLKDQANINITPSYILNNNNNLSNISKLINHSNNNDKPHDNDIIDYAMKENEKINWSKEFLSLDRSIQIGDKEIAKIPTDSKALINVFLTGATGFLGSFILHQLLTTPNIGSVYCLTRPQQTRGLLSSSSSSIDKQLYDDRVRLFKLITQKYKLKLDEPDMSRIIPVSGDLSRPLLGLPSEQEFKELANNVELIIHNGAVVNMVIPYANLRDTNVGATCEIFKLASIGEKIKPVSFISTMGVYAFADSDIQESDIPPTHFLDQMNGYSQSKLVAEHIVRDAHKRGFPVIMFRPATIYCDSRSGIDNDHDFVHMIFKGLLELGSCPDVRSLYVGGTFNLSPVDWVSHSIARLSLDNQSYHYKDDTAAAATASTTAVATDNKSPQSPPIYHMINEVHTKLASVSRVINEHVKPLQEVSLQEFQSLVESVKDANHAIYPIRSVFKTSFPGHQRYNYRCPQTTKHLQSLGFDKCPPVSDKTLELNLKYLNDQITLKQQQTQQ